MPPCLRWQVAVTHKNSYPPSLSIHYCITYILLREYFCQSLPTKTDVPRKQELSPPPLLQWREESLGWSTLYGSVTWQEPRGLHQMQGGKVGVGFEENVMKGPFTDLYQPCAWLTGTNKGVECPASHSRSPPSPHVGEQLPDRSAPSPECHPVRQGSLEAKEQEYLDAGQAPGTLGGSRAWTWKST